MSGKRSNHRLCFVRPEQTLPTRGCSLLWTRISSTQLRPSASDLTVSTELTLKSPSLFSILSHQLMMIKTRVIKTFHKPVKLINCHGIHCVYFQHTVYRRVPNTLLTQCPATTALFDLSRMRHIFQLKVFANSQFITTNEIISK